MNTEQTTSVSPHDSNAVLAARCIYCKEGSTEKHPMLFRVYTAGEYWQHWNFENSGCEANTENISPNGNIFKRNGC
jgi:hypothetical protein